MFTFASSTYSRSLKALTNDCCKPENKQQREAALNRSLVSKPPVSTREKTECSPICWVIRTFAGTYQWAGFVSCFCEYPEQSGVVSWRYPRQKRRGSFHWYLFTSFRLCPYRRETCFQTEQFKLWKQCIPNPYRTPSSG